MNRRLVIGGGLVLMFALGAFIGTQNRDGSTDAELADVEAATITSSSTTSTTSTTTSTTTTTTTTLPPPRTATLAFTGDLLPHGSVVRTAAENAAANGDEGWDFRPMFDEVRPILSGADLAICHLETPISFNDTNLSGFPTFNAPRALVEGAIDAGYDGCSTASNHSYDRSASGVVGTLDAMGEMGMPQAGMARSDQEDLSPVLYEANGIQIAHISATYGLNGFSLPADQQYLVDLIRPEDIVHEAALAREAGAEFVIVSLHWGNEYRHEPTSAQNAWLEEILPSDEVDLIIGHHAHVVQPVDKVGDEWVVFGLGNFLSNQSVNCCVTASQDGMIVTVRLFEAADGTIEATGVHYTPTWVDRHNGYVIRLAEPGRDDLPTETAKVLEGSMGRTESVVSSRLGPIDGLTTESDLNPSVGQAADG